MRTPREAATSRAQGVTIAPGAACTSPPGGTDWTSSAVTMSFIVAARDDSTGLSRAEGGSRAPELRSRPSMRRAALTLGLLGAIAAGCRRASPPVTRFPDAPVVLISIDTLRADHLPAYGYTAGSTPNIDRLVREGVVFEDLYSHCPLTLPAHASMLTGLLPPHHGVRDNIGFRLASDHATLATRLRTAGLRTGGAVSAYVLRAATGISQAFEFFDDKIEVEAGTESIGNLQRDGALTTRALSAWIDGQKDARLFAFLHLY